MKLCVSMGPPTEGGRLNPRYDTESDILAVTTEIPRDWPYGVDIDGKLVFDLDSKRTLANFDIHVGRRLWERGAVRCWPSKAPAGSIVFLKETVEQKSMSIPVRFVYDEGKGILSVVFGSRKPERELELSKNCLALLSDTELVGFLLRGFLDEGRE